jgi:hypothetical protein
VSEQSPAAMNESHFSEIEKVLLYVSDARQRADRAAKTIAKSGAEPHLVVALERASESLGELRSTLMKSTYFAVVKEALDQDRLSV